MTNDKNGLLIAELDPHQKAITENESASILARWEFGRVLRAQIPEGKKQLPNGLRESVTRHYGLNGTEITRRLQLAEKCKTSAEVAKLSEKYGHAWRRIVLEALPKAERKEKPLPPFAERVQGDLDRWIGAATCGDDRRAELVALLTTALAKLIEADEAKVAA